MKHCKFLSRYHFKWYLRLRISWLQRWRATYHEGSQFKYAKIYSENIKSYPSRFLLRGAVYRIRYDVKFNMIKHSFRNRRRAPVADPGDKSCHGPIQFSYRLWPSPTKWDTGEHIELIPLAECLDPPHGKLWYGCSCFYSVFFSAIPGTFIVCFVCLIVVTAIVASVSIFMVRR